MSENLRNMSYNERESDNNHDYYVGGSGDDNKMGGSGDDDLNGAEGNDHLHGGLGRDKLHGGFGSDLLDGDDGSDELFGEDGNDTLNGGNGDDVIDGGVGDDTLAGGDGDDRLSTGLGNDSMDGGAGLDTATYSGRHADYRVVKTATGYSIADSTGTSGTDTLINVERLTFTDSKLALDLDGAAGQSYRLYQAALARNPDVDGLSYWVKKMDGGETLAQVASGFTNSTEFKSLYGANASNDTFVTALYLNVLHRAPDSEGQAYWRKHLDDGLETREQVLLGFSESTENHVNVIGSIQDGITLNLL